MKINSINGVSIQMGMNQAMDSYSQNIQNQIANAQKQLQELSSSEDMTLEEKMKKRQEIQQQINDLNMQLRQHQMEQRREKQQAKGSSMNDMLGGTRDAGSKNTGISQASMIAMISANNSIKQAKVHGSVSKSMEGKMGILESEIENSHGGNIEKKQEELADVEQKAQAAAASQLSTLADAIKTLEETAKADSKEEKIGNKGAKTASAKEKNSEENVSSADVQGENVLDSESVNTESDDFISKSTSAVQNTITTQQPIAYTSVDIRL